MSSPVTVIIADDQPLIRDGIAAILSMEDGYEVLARSADGETAVEQTRLHRPTLVLMDIHMPGLDGLQATRRIRAECPDTKIMVLTTFEDEEYVLEAMRCGASGYLVKGMETDKLLSAIRDCLNGRISYPSTIQQRLIRALAATERAGPARPAPSAGTAVPPDGADELTERERHILQHLKQGKSNQAIASELFLTTGTVKNYLNAIYRKLGVASRSEAIAYLYGHEA